MHRSHIGVSCTKEEKETLEAAAKLAGLPLSVWLKRLGLIAAGVLEPMELRAQLDRIEGKEG